MPDAFAARKLTHTKNDLERILFLKKIDKNIKMERGKRNITKTKEKKNEYILYDCGHFSENADLVIEVRHVFP